MAAAPSPTITINGREVAYRLVRSKTARKLRVRVGPRGVEVVQPAGRTPEETSAFLRSSSDWIASQLERVERLGHLRRPQRVQTGEILYHGNPTPVRVEIHSHRRGPNRVLHDGSTLVIVCGAGPTAPAKTLENWLRRQVRGEIQRYLVAVTHRLGHRPEKIYVMGQRTKWGNCSRTRNLSFNWRLILAPSFVLHYLVTHEAVHLAVPDHSARFWLTVQSLCQDTERARQWLSANGDRLRCDLGEICRGPEHRT
jgi:predicted metal-dependent hydrolase